MTKKCFVVIAGEARQAGCLKSWVFEKLGASDGIIQHISLFQAKICLDGCLLDQIDVKNECFVPTVLLNLFIMFGCRTLASQS